MARSSNLQSRRVHIKHYNLYHMAVAGSLVLWLQQVVGLVFVRLSL